MASQRSESFSLSSGDHYNGETAGASFWSPRTWHMDDNLGLRAEDASPQSDAPRDLRRLGKYARDEKSGLFAPLSASVFNTTQLRRVAGTSINSQACSLRTPPACLRIALPSSQHKPQYHLCPLHLSACPELCLTCNRIQPLVLPASPEFWLGVRTGIKTPDNQ